jgi:putative endopeptidase
MSAGNPLLKRSWCRERTMQGDPHPVAKYRVNGRAFQCKADAPMVRTATARSKV